MFSPVPMLWLSVVVREKDARRVLRAVGELGVLHLARTTAAPGAPALHTRDAAGELARWDGLLAQAGELRRSLDIPAGTMHRPAGLDAPIEEIDRMLALLKARAGSLLLRREQLRQQSTLALSLCERLAWLGDIDFPLDHAERFSFLQLAIGSVPAAMLPQLRSTLHDRAILSARGRHEDRCRLVAATARRWRREFESALRQADFHAETLPGAGGDTVASLLAASRGDAEQATAELEQIERQLAALAAESAPVLGGVEIRSAMERRLLEAEGTFSRTDSTVLLTGWASAADTRLLARQLDELTDGRCLVRAESPDGLPEEQVPIRLQHARVLRPFASLVAGYGLPRYRELAPTLFVALGYLLMFGMMFGDIGHGAVLAAAGWLAMRCCRRSAMRDAGLLLICAGGASAVFGAVYGSCFGIASLRHYALWRDPLEGNPADLMYVAVIIGVGIISLGLVLNIVNRARRREFLAAFMDKFGIAGALFYWGTLLVMMRYASLHTAGLIVPALIVFVALPLLVWMLRRPLEHALAARGQHRADHESWLSVIAESAVEAFEALLVYLANTVSFVRLAAYAMSHAALLMATFLVAGAVDNGSAHGSVLAVLIIIAGNLVAIVLEGVVATVQTVRLEYYEFFSKFFSGEGRPFEPFCLTGESEPAAAGASRA